MLSITDYVFLKSKSILPLELQPKDFNSSCAFAFVFKTEQTEQKYFIFQAIIIHTQ